MVALRFPALMAASLFTALALGGCPSHSPMDGRNSLTTPDHFSEADLFITNERDATGLFKLVPGTDTSQPAAKAIAEGDPITIIVRSVYLPEAAAIEDLDKRPDIALILDLQLTATRKVNDLAVVHQRDVRPGTRLNFRDLTVYSTLAYNRNFAPYFRLRLIDLDKPEARAMAGLLDQGDKINSSVGSAFPNPYTAVVGLALKVGQALIAMDDDDTLMDFEFQLYPVAALNSAIPINRLYEGQWLAVGLPNNESERSAFYNRKDLSWDASQGRLFGKDKDGKLVRVDVPIVAFTILREALVTADIIKARTADFSRYLEEFDGQHPSVVKAMTEAIQASTALFSAIQRVELTPGVTDFMDAYNALVSPQTASVPPEDVKVMLTVLRRRIAVPDTPKFGSPDDLKSWWAKMTAGNKKPSDVFEVQGGQLVLKAVGGTGE